MIRCNLIAAERGHSAAVRLLDTERLLADMGEPSMIEETVERAQLLDLLAADLREYSAIACALFTAWRSRVEAHRANGAKGGDS